MQTKDIKDTKAIKEAAGQSKAQLAPTAQALSLALVTIFALLWAIWCQPHTIALRNGLLSIGSVLGLYVMLDNRRLLTCKAAWPLYLLGLLLAWITFHLLFLSHQYELQLQEYFTIWKRIVWGAPLAIGLGLALTQSGSKQPQSQKALILGSPLRWWIFYLGILAPTIVYLIRSLLMALAQRQAWQLPPIAMHMDPSSTWHIPKMAIVFFCVPALAIACGQCVRIAQQSAPHNRLLASIYAASIIAVLAVFYLENAKNGMAYSVMCLGAMLVKMVINKKSRWTWRNTVITALSILAIGFVLKHHIEHSPEWKTLFADIKVAAHLDQSDAWKDYGARGYPRNELGTVVSETNYTRAAWAQVAIRFIAQYPLGYGLVYTSFGHLAKENWPISTLVQCHSAWLDLTLGIGIPGVALLLLAGALALNNAQKAPSKLWSSAASWGLLSVALLMITTEVSHSPYIEALLFLLLWVAGLGLRRTFPAR